jgi:anaerobic magnesium-protoporphyrin IX monomethyl ester cyclase
MRVLFVSMNLYTPFLRVFSQGLGILSATLKAAGHDVRVVEVNREADLRDLGRAVRDFDPDVVGMNGAANQAPYFADVVGTVRAASARARVIIGGWHATLRPEQTLRDSGADAVLCGEGEVALPAYLDDLGRGGDGRSAPNFWFLEGGAVLSTPPAPYIQDLDSLPLADYGAVDYQGVLDENIRVAVLLAGRGCPWACTFCSVGYMKQKGAGKYARLRSVGHVIGELEHLKANYQVDHVFFRDDTFTWHREWAMEFCEAMATRQLLPFEILSRVDCLDDEMIAALKRAGCTCVWIGIDAGDGHIRMDLLEKGTTYEQIIDTADRLHAAGITVMTTNMVGLPHETPEKFRKTVELNRRIYRDRLAFSPGGGSGPKIFVYGPFPGTPMADECERMGWAPDYPKGYRIYCDSFLQMPDFPRAQILKAYRDFRYEVYRPAFPARAWLYRLWDHGLGRVMNTYPATRSTFIQLAKVAKGVLGIRDNA